MLIITTSSRGLNGHWIDTPPIMAVSVMKITLNRKDTAPWNGNQWMHRPVCREHPISWKESRRRNIKCFCRWVSTLRVRPLSSLSHSLSVWLCGLQCFGDSPWRRARVRRREWLLAVPHPNGGRGVSFRSAVLSVPLLFGVYSFDADGLLAVWSNCNQQSGGLLSLFLVGHFPISRFVDGLRDGMGVHLQCPQYGQCVLRWQWSDDSEFMGHDTMGSVLRTRILLDGQSKATKAMQWEFECFVVLLCRWSTTEEVRGDGICSERGHDAPLDGTGGVVRTLCVFANLYLDAFGTSKEIEKGWDWRGEIRRSNSRSRGTARLTLLFLNYFRCTFTLYLQGSSVYLFNGSAVHNGLKGPGSDAIEYQDNRRCRLSNEKWGIEREYAHTHSIEIQIDTWKQLVIASTCHLFMFKVRNGKQFKLPTSLDRWCIRD